LPSGFALIPHARNYGATGQPWRTRHSRGFATCQSCRRSRVSEAAPAGRYFHTTPGRASIVRRGPAPSAVRARRRQLVSKAGGDQARPARRGQGTSLESLRLLGATRLASRDGPSIRGAARHAPAATKSRKPRTGQSRRTPPMTCQPRESHLLWGLTPQALDINGVFEPTSRFARFVVDAGASVNPRGENRG